LYLIALIAHCAQRGHIHPVCQVRLRCLWSQHLPSRLPAGRGRLLLSRGSHVSSACAADSARFQLRSRSVGLPDNLHGDQRNTNSQSDKRRSPAFWHVMIDEHKHVCTRLLHAAAICPSSECACGHVMGPWPRRVFVRTSTTIQ
jgi:hypothetical protein